METGEVDGVEGYHRDCQQEADELDVTRKVLSAMEESADLLRREVES